DLKELSNLDLDRLPYEGLKAALEKAGQLAPRDGGVTLGMARLAIEDGRWEEASIWLRRCRETRPDGALWKAWLAWAGASGDSAEVLNALRQLGPGRLDPAERLELRAWLARKRTDAAAESAALEQWLQIEPYATRALERLAEIAHQAGNSERVVELRRR